MKSVAIIPARFNAQRFPGKLLKKINNKTIIQITYENTVQSNLFEQVIVATDDQRIFNHIIEIGGNARMTNENHVSGSDRIAEVAQELDSDIIVNIQGDEPFLHHDSLNSLLEIFKNDNKKEVDVATLMEVITEEKVIYNPNNVKVVVDNNNNALYFSRSAIPYVREKQTSTKFYKHLGLYAYRKEALMKFSSLSKCTLEATEKLEQLRYLENGFKIRLAITPHSTIGIDTPEDLEEAKRKYKEIGI